MQAPWVPACRESGLWVWQSQSSISTSRSLHLSWLSLHLHRNGCEKRGALTQELRGQSSQTNALLRGWNLMPSAQNGFSTR